MLKIERLPAVVIALILLFTVLIAALIGGKSVPLLERAEPDPGGCVFHSLEELDATKYVYGNRAKLLDGDPLSSYSPHTYKYYFHAPEHAGEVCAVGVDVSSRQGPIDWFSARAGGVEFAFLRAGSRGYTEGAVYEDAAFDANAAFANAAGVKIGAYFYSQATNVDEILEEANVLLRRAAPYDISLPLVLDFEYADVEGRDGGRLFDARLSVDEATEMCLAFCDAVRAEGYEPAVYANSYMLKNHLDAARLAQACPIWIAYPGTENPYSGEYTYWQYTWSGHVDGIRGSVDCDFMYRN